VNTERKKNNTLWLINYRIPFHSNNILRIQILASQGRSYDHSASDWSSTEQVARETTQKLHLARAENCIYHKLVAIFFWISRILVVTSGYTFLLLRLLCNTRLLYVTVVKGRKMYQRMRSLTLYVTSATFKCSDAKPVQSQNYLSILR